MYKGTILYVGCFELPDKNAAAHRVLSNAKILRELGYNVVFLGITKEELSGNKSVIDTFDTVQGFDSYYVQYPQSTIAWMSYLVGVDGFKIICEKYDNIVAAIFYNQQAVSLKRAMMLCKKKNIKVIGDCTEWYSARSRNPIFFVLKGLDTFYRMRILQKKMDGLIVISDYLENYYSNCSNVVNVPPLVDLEEKKWEKTQYNRTDGTLKLVYAGSPGKKDKIDILLRALSLMDFKFYLNIVGITRKEYLSVFPEQESILNKLGDSVSFRGRLGHLETLEYVKNADYSCFFREENRVTKAGFPTKFVESVSCATAVLTNSSSNISRYSTENRDIILPNLDVKSICDALKTAFESISEKKDNEVCNDIFDYRKYVNLFETKLGVIYE